jgi:ABC-type uncharacterized transport system substrate-binding protein
VPQDLQQTLATLHQELAQTRSVDRESRELLVTVMQDIARVLDRSLAESADDEDSLGERLEHVAVRFASEHPQLSAAVRQVIDALANAGI